MQFEDVDPDVEQYARALIQAGGADPDTLVQPGQPVIFGTPQGNAFKVNPDTLQPLWRFYIQAAKIGLEIARGQFRKKGGDPLFLHAGRDFTKSTAPQNPLVDSFVPADLPGNTMGDKAMGI